MTSFDTRLCRNLCAKRKSLLFHWTMFCAYYEKIYNNLLCILWYLKKKIICFTRLNSKLNTPTQAATNQAEERNSFFIEPFHARGEYIVVVVLYSFHTQFYIYLVGLFCCCV